MSQPNTIDAATDENFMRRAIELAARGQGRVEPNPLVGCVIVRDGQIVGEGYHQAYGGHHAEVEAIRSLGASSAQGATAYVSLEPCCHHGKTPPCTDSLIKAGVKRVVFEMEDPFPKVAGGGSRQLSESGIEVTRDVLREEAIKLNRPYLKRIEAGKPWVIAKWAMTVDGKIATHTGSSQWITSDPSRLDVHQTRARVDGIITGMGTVRSDNPELNARLPPEFGKPPRIADRIVMCRQSIPAAESKLLSTAAQIPVRLVVGPNVTQSQIDQASSLGAVIHRVNEMVPSRYLCKSLQLLAELGMTNLLVEAGSELLASFFDAREIDEYHIYMGPLIVGNQQAPSPIGGTGVKLMNQAMRLALDSVQPLGDDVKIIYRSREESRENEL